MTIHRKNFQIVCPPASKYFSVDSELGDLVFTIPNEISINLNMENFPVSYSHWISVISDIAVGEMKKKLDNLSDSDYNQSLERKRLRVEIQNWQTWENLMKENIERKNDNKDDDYNRIGY